MRMGSWWPRLRAGIRDLNPGYFALVMATGIVSQAMRLDGAAALSGFLLGAGIVAYVVLLIAYGWRLAGYRREFLADATDPSRAFAFFTFTAASDVLGARLAADGHTAAAAVLLAAGGAGWLLLSYSVPLLLAGRPSLAPALAGANGTWFICVVGTQSIAGRRRLAAKAAARGPGRAGHLLLGGGTGCSWARPRSACWPGRSSCACRPRRWAPPCTASSRDCRWCCGRSGPG